MTPLDYAAIALATFYGAVAIVKPGPWRVFDWLRAHLPHGGLLSCPVCLAFWLSLIFYGLIGVGLSWIVYAIAPAGLAVFAWRYSGGEHV